MHCIVELPGTCVIYELIILNFVQKPFYSLKKSNTLGVQKARWGTNGRVVVEWSWKGG